MYNIIFAVILAARETIIHFERSLGKDTLLLYYVGGLRVARRIGKFLLIINNNNNNVWKSTRKEEEEETAINKESKLR